MKSKIKTSIFRSIRRRLPKGNLSLSGFTLVELMVVSTIFVMVILTLFAGLVGGRRAWLVSEAHVDIHTQARKALNTMADALSQAAPGNVTITNISANEDQIAFRTPVAYDDVAGTITWSDQMRYSLGGVNGQQVLLTNLNTGATETFGNYITTLDFNQPEADVVEIILILNRQSLKGDNLQLPLSSQITLRNR